MSNSMLPRLRLLDLPYTAAVSTAMYYLFEYTPDLVSLNG